MNTMSCITHTFDVGNGKPVTLETGKLARQANGSVLLRIENTMLLATVVSSKEAREGVDFLPLSVDYQEKFASTGRIPGSFHRREGKLSDYEVLISRLVDRALRPLFPEDYHADIQILIYLISSDGENQPDALAGLAASAALALSDIPFHGPISEVRVGKINGKLCINPTLSEMKESTMDMIIGATEKDIVMVEGEMDEITESEMLEAIKFAHQTIQKHIKEIRTFVSKAGNKSPREYQHEKNDPELKERIYRELFQKIYQAASAGEANKTIRKESFSSILKEFKKQFSEEELEEKEALIDRYYHEAEYNAVRKLLLEERVRLDGRKPDEIRSIWCEVNYLPAAHGSALFTRGETQSLTTVTLGTPLDALLKDGAFIQDEERIILHYNFPAFSTGEVKPSRGPGRREIGHGNLAYRALKRMIPINDLPYTIRIVSDILESNGSSSMATACAGCLALMDAGIQIKKPVAGIAMGLITGENGNYVVLSDILGDEDHLGDMDFKVCGTRDGITAVQMDLKVNGLPYEVMAEALEQARKGRLHILNEMLKAIPSPRPDFKPHAPRFIKMEVPLDMIGAIIGPGGKIIQEIQRNTQTTIVVEDKDGSGVVEIFGKSMENVSAAKEEIRKIVALPEVGEVYDAKVKAIMPYGAFVEILPGKDGLLHISEYAWERTETLEGILKEGDIVQVKYIGDDPKTKKIKLSRKVLLPKP